ncbi:hypothetical protein C2W64_01370 [Brevibacillus laterosporus]|uniref:Uncharacterized protein n=1 Tax=Brevibacillus laterosporus TaxID=1465 RepID=A0A518V5W7_BRELA|nr:hypothetical protein [Brevibacillus laterosporus]QDX92397.1 hypothetical protein EEL30_08685 [Brevibacillus laterosporus]RAP26654.1 hypothetical protein C2W64_01370 [Brevibacillus laterosporus]
MDKRKIILPFITTAILFSGGYLLYSSNHTETAQSNQSHKISQVTTNTSKKVVNLSGDVQENFDSIDDLKESSEVIAEVEIMKDEGFEYRNVIFTLSESKLQKVYKGDFKEGDTLEILETGGFKDGVEYTFEGNEVLKEKDTAIVFLEKYEGPVAENAYVIKGVYQGKFIKNNDKLKTANGVSQGLKVNNIQELGF